MIDASRLNHVRSLFEEGSQVTLRIGLESAVSALGLLGSTDSPAAERAECLARASGHTMQRLSETFVRLAFLDWLRQQFVGREKPTDEWRAFASLAVKDFHADVASLMDSVAPIIILADGKLKKEDRDKLPGFADIQAGSHRSYRAALAEDVSTLVDSTDDWWTDVKRVRDRLIHRVHYRIVFGRPEDGFYFQVYNSKDDPLITDPLLEAPTGTQVMDFSLYSVWVISEIIHFLDRLGGILIQRFSMPAEFLLAGGRIGDARPFLLCLDELSRRATQNLGEFAQQGAAQDG